MLTYRDITFCSAYGVSCSNKDCHRAFTPEVEHAAQHWWLQFNQASYPPVAVSNFYDFCDTKIPINT